MDKQGYVVEVFQPDDVLLIEVMISRGHRLPVYLGAQIGLNFNRAAQGEQVLEVVVSSNCAMPYRPTLPEAAEFVRWYNLARSAGECLAGLIQTADDLRRPVEASINGDTVVVRFVGEKNTRAEDKQPDSDESDNFDEPFGFDPDGDYSDWAGEQI